MEALISAVTILIAVLAGAALAGELLEENTRLQRLLARLERKLDLALQPIVSIPDPPIGWLPWERDGRESAEPQTG